MAKNVSFDNVDNSAADLDPEVQTPTAQVPATQNANTQLAEYDDFECSNDGFAEETDIRQIKIPRIQLVHGVGELGKAGYIPGSLVYNSSVVLIEPKRGENFIKALDGVTIYMLAGIGGGLDYVETITNAQHEAGVKPRAFRTEQAAIAAGLSMGKAWRAKNDKTAPKYSPRLTVMVLVEAPAAVGTAAFPMEFGGKHYAIASLTLTKGSYWKAGTELYTGVNTARMLDRGNPGKFPLWFTGWKLFTKYEVVKGSENGSWCIWATQGQKATPEFIEWARQFAPGAVKPAAGQLAAPQQ